MGLFTDHDSCGCIVQRDQNSQVIYTKILLTRQTVSVSSSIRRTYGVHEHLRSHNEYLSRPGRWHQCYIKAILTHTEKSWLPLFTRLRIYVYDEATYAGWFKNIFYRSMKQTRSLHIQIRPYLLQSLKLWRGFWVVRRLSGDLSVWLSGWDNGLQIQKQTQTMAMVM